MPSGVYKRTKEMKKNISKARLKRKQELGYLNSPETRKKMSESRQKRKQELGYLISPEARKKLSEEGQKRYSEKDKDGKSINHPCYGKNQSEDHRKKISESRQKRKRELGYINSPEARIKQGKTISGENNPNWNPNREEVYFPYGENFFDEELRNEKWNLQKGRDLLTGTILDLNKRPQYHHIDYNKSNNDPDNHCFISHSNHMRITSYRSNQIKSKKFKKILQENTLALKNEEIPKYWSQINKELFRQEKLKQLDLSSYII